MNRPLHEAREHMFSWLSDSHPQRQWYGECLDRVIALARLEAFDEASRIVLWGDPCGPYPNAPLREQEKYAYASRLLHQAAEDLRRMAKEEG